MTSPELTAPAGTLTAPKHVFSTFIRATPDAIWRAITESEFTTRYWYGSSIQSDWAVGSRYELRTANDQPAIAGDVLESDPPRRLVMTYKSPWDGKPDEEPSRVSFEIDEAGPGVAKLTVVHETAPGSTAQIAEVAAGWPFIIAGLKTLLETGSPLSAE